MMKTKNNDGSQPATTRRRFLKQLGAAAGGAFALSLVPGELFAASKKKKDAEADAGVPAIGDYEVEYGPYLQKPAETSMTVMWTTRKPGIAWVEYWDAENPSEHKFAEDVRLGLRNLRTPRHCVQIRGLEPGKKYAYKVFAQKETLPFVPKAQADEAKPDGVFTTLDPKAKSSRAFIVNDMHVPIKSRDRIMPLFEKGDAASCDLIFHNGDILDYWPGDYWAPKTPDPIYAAVLHPLVPVIANVPFIFVRGNHEYRGYNSMRAEEAFPVHASGGFYTLMRQGDVCYVILDTGEDHRDTGKQSMWEDYFDDEMAWLREAVKTDAFRTAKRRVVIQHIKPLMTDKHSAEKVRDHFYPGAKMLTTLIPILEKAKIDVMICGHEHVNEFFPAGTRKEISFPILVNDNSGYVVLESVGGKMTLKQFTKNGGNVRTLKF
ncbi:MAG: metallophosphoesterase [Candidatus Spyradosoma sp.]